MVNKMKINFSLALFLLFLPFGVQSAEPVRPLLKTDVIRCGTDLSVKSYARKSGKTWKGFDADMCRAFAWAIYGDGNKFKMVDVRPHQIKQAFNDNMIDVMLSGGFYSADIEARYYASSIGLMYYDRQMFAGRDVQEQATSMNDFKGKIVCVINTGGYLDNLRSYNKKHELNLRILPFKTLTKAREALLLKRCELISANGMLLQGMNLDVPGRKLQILPEEFAHKPVYAFVDQNNNRLRTALKWVMNGLYLAEKLGITQQNVNTIIANNDSTRNLLGDEELLWLRFNLYPLGLRNAIAELGNMGEIYDRNLGTDSLFKLERGKANLIQNGGIVHAEDFQ